MLAQSWSASSSAVLYWAEGSKQISFACDVRNDACASSVILKPFLFFVDTFVLCSLGSSALLLIQFSGAVFFWPVLI